ncbi:MAG TPA: LLM class flavin-dependent oxidoreductase [Candidatus Binataceae bacterium]|nr:LLM class flavin-dependent oxidoreductase [Candidatus Binataceae bacterium]
MELGLQFARMEPAACRALAQTAEGLGYDLITFPDHVLMEGPEGQYDPHTPLYDVMQVAAIVADATKKIRIGHLVLCNLFRHPVMTAQSLATLDNISNGRAIAGLGSGWTEREFRTTGMQFPPIGERLRMLDEALTCMRSLWTNEETTFAGEFYQLKDAILWPKPKQKPYPPILLGGGGKGLLRLAAKHGDAINLIAETGKAGRITIEEIKRLTNDAFREKISFVREEAKKFGRDPGKIVVSNVVFNLMLTDSREATRKTLESMAPMFGTTVEAMAQSSMSLIGTPEECVIELRRRVKDWSVSQFIFASMTGLDEKLIRRLKEEVLAHL